VGRIAIHGYDFAWSASEEMGRSEVVGYVLCTPKISCWFPAFGIPNRGVVARL
jgi:hypothetical protein